MEVGIVNWLSLDDHDFTKVYENLWSLLQSEQVRKAQLGAMDANLRPCKGKKAFDGDFSYWELGKKEEKLEQLFSGSGPYPTMVSLFRPDYFWTPYGDDGADTMYQSFVKYHRSRTSDGDYESHPHLLELRGGVFRAKPANYNDEVKVQLDSFDKGWYSWPVSWTVTPALVLNVGDEDCVLGPAKFGYPPMRKMGGKFLNRDERIQGTSKSSTFLDTNYKSDAEKVFLYVHEVAQVLGLDYEDIGIMGDELLWFVVLNESFNEGWMDFLREKCPKGWAAYREQCLEWWSSQQKGYALQSPIPKWAWSKP